MATKLILLFTAILVVAVYGLPAKERDYTSCNPQWGDGVLYQGAVDKPSKLLQVVSFDLPVTTTNAVIHCIKVINSKAGSTPAAVSVTGGGVGYSYVTLHFESSRNHGIHYNVTISGGLLQPPVH